MTLPEWAASVLVTTLILLMAFLGKRMLGASDKQTEALGKIGDQLAKINVRIGEGDVWMTMHAREDDRMFKMIGDVHREMWWAINRRDNLSRGQLGRSELPDRGRGVEEER